MTPRRCGFLLLAGLLLLATPLAKGQEEAAPKPSDGAPQAESPLVIQSVPASELPKFLTNERPLRRSVLEEFLKTRAAMSPQGEASPPTVFASRAFYDARFSSDGLLTGKARVEIVSRSAEPVLLATPDLSLSIHSVRWKDRDEPALWGLGPDGVQVLVVPQSGELEFDWSLRGMPAGPHRFTYALGLLRAAKSELELSAPRAWRPSIKDAAGRPISADDADIVRHGFSLGVSHRAELRFDLEGPNSDASTACSVRQQARIDVGRQGIDLSTELEVAPIGGPLRRLSLRVDPSLQVVSAMMGDQPLPWTIEGEGSERMLHLQFEPPLQEGGRKIHIEARAGEPGEAISPLPQLRPLEAHWRESEWELHIAPPLELSGIELRQGRLIDAGPVISSRGGETRRIRLYSPTGEIRASFRTPEFRGRLLYAARVAASESSFELAAAYRIAVESGSTFDLTAAIPPGWVIDNVDSAPNGAIENWGVAADENHQTLTIRLSRALSSRAPLQLRIAAHLPRVGVEPLSSQQFFLGVFDHLTFERGLLRLAGSSGIRLDAVGDGAAPIAATSLSVEESEMLPSGDSGSLYAISPNSNFTIAHAAAAPAFRTETVTRLVLERGRFLSRHRIKVTPQQQQLDRLVVRLRPATGAEVGFALEGGQRSAISAVLLESQPHGDRWEVRLLEPTSGEFLLTVVENIPIADSNTARSVVCEGAASEETQIRALAADFESWEVRASGVLPIFGRTTGQDSSDLREIAAYRTASSESTVITIERKQNTAAAPTIWAWFEQRNTYAGDDSEHVHESILRLQCKSAADALFDLPQDARLLSVRLNEAPLSAARQEGNTLRVPLLGVETPQTLQIRVAAPRKPREWGLEPVEWNGAIPRFSTLAGRWSIWAPADQAIEHQAAKRSFWSWAALAMPTRGVEKESPKTESESVADSGAMLSHRAGWRAFPLPIGAAVESRSFRYAETAWRIAGWCAWAAMILAAQFRRAGTTWGRLGLLLLILAAGGGSYFAPAPLQLLLSGVFLGGVFGLLAAAVRTRSPEPTIAPPQGFAAALRTAVVLLLLGLPGAALWAQAPQDPPAAPKRNLFDPVDAEGAPVGDFVYVSPELFEELLRTTPTRAGETCLLERARYRVLRSNDPQARELALSVEYTYVAFADAQVAPIPLLAPRTAISGGVIYVDGERRSISQADESRPLQVELLGRGGHNVRFELSLPIETESDFAVARLSSLPLARQDLEIETDSSLAWTLDGVPIKHDPVNRLATLRLEPNRTTRIALRRSEDPSSLNEIAFRHDAWITIAPGSTTIDHRLVMAPETTASGVIFELDERLQLDSVTDGARRSITPVSLGGGRWRAPLSLNATEDANVLRISCSLTSGLGVGRFSDLGIAFPNAKITATRIAASATAELEVLGEPRVGVTEISTAEFAADWAFGRTPPQVALSVEPGRTWNLLVRPKSPQRSVQQRTEVVIHPQHLRLQVEAEIAAGVEPASVYTLQVPAALRIESLSVMEGATNRLLRHTRSAPDRITLFMRTASNEPRRLQLRGAIDFDPAQPVPIPAIQIDQASLSSHTIRLYRGHDALVELGSLKALRQVELPPSPSVEESILEPQSSRLIALLDAPSGAQPWEGSFTASPNEPKWTHESRIRFAMRDSKWRFEQTIALQVEQGLLDGLQLDLPPGFVEPLTASSGESVRVLREEGASPRLLIYPSSPWKGSQRITLNGEFAPDSSTSELTFGPLPVRGGVPLARWIAAPRRFGGGDFTWVGQNAVEAPPPEGEPTNETLQWFQLQPESGAIQLQRSASAQEASTARLQGLVHIAGDEFAGVLTWYFNAASTGEIILSAPSEVQVVQARLLGASARLSQIDERRWRLEATGSTAPPILELTCLGRFAAGKPAGKPLPLPQLSDVEISHTYLEIRTQAEIALSEELKPHLVSPRAAAMARLEQLDRLRRESVSLLATLNPSEAQLWRGRWRLQWEAARSQFAALESGASPAARPSWLREADAERDRIAEELAADAALSENAAPGAAVLREALASPDAGEKAFYLVSDKPLPAIHLQPHDPLAAAAKELTQAGDRFPWLTPLLLVAIGAVIFFASSASRRAAARELAPLVGWTLLGAAWWTWLTPNWLGPLFAVIVILGLALRWTLTRLQWA